MASLVRHLQDRLAERGLPIPFQSYVDLLNFNNVMYPVGYSQTLLGDREELWGDFSGLCSGAYQANGVVFACLYTRQLHFMQARFQFRQMRNGRPGNLFGTAALAPLESPWPNGTTQDLLGRMIQDADLSGNSYTVKGDAQFIQDGRRGRLAGRGSMARLRPDWVQILLGSNSDRSGWVPGDPDTEVVGYVYKPGGHASQAPEMLFDVRDVAHWTPIKDPQANYKGVSLMLSVLQEIRADQQMTSHRLKFFENGATVNLVIQSPPAVVNQSQFQEWVRIIREGHEGVARAYKTLFLDAGAQVTPIGADLQQNDFRAVQGAGEVRIALAFRVPPTLLGLSEGLQGSTLNAGNFQQSRRNFADGVLRPLWAGAAGALQTIIPTPTDAVLWYDDRDIAFLKEDQKDAAEIRQLNATTAKSLIDAGAKWDAIVDYITSDDFGRLRGQHTGLSSVQLQPPATNNGSQNGSAAGTQNGNPMAPAQLGG